MTELTSRYGLPMLASGQAQKEITHNEALLLLDALAHATIESRSVSAPPPQPQPGEIWLIAAAPTGDWLGKVGQLAVSSNGGWRYIVPKAGMILWSKADAVYVFFDGAVWVVGSWPVQQLTVAGQKVVASRQPAIADPVSGTTLDIQARAAIINILNTLRTHGLIAI
jgi:enamine deaminase RidA (YjgF/YER057c/UK114 family)